MLQSTIPVLLCTYCSSSALYYKVVLCTIKNYSSTTLYYKVLCQYYQLCTTKYYSSTTPYRKSFQNDRFVRGFLQKKVPKQAFRARLPTIFTEEGSKMIVSCQASSKFHKRRFQNEPFVRSFLQFLQKKVPK